jgi:antitoxin ParD1/3/4
MNVSLTPELEEFVSRKVESGMYSSASEVVRESLRLLREQDLLKQIRLEELRKEIGLGIEQLERGQSRPFDADDIKRRICERVAEQKDR